MLEVVEYGSDLLKRCLCSVYVLLSKIQKTSLLFSEDNWL